MPENGWLKQQRFIAPSSGGWSLRSGHQHGQVPGEVVLLVCRWLYSYWILIWQTAVGAVISPMSLLIRTLISFLRTLPP